MFKVLSPAKHVLEALKEITDFSVPVFHRFHSPFIDGVNVVPPASNTTGHT